jgi:hypothetical protein
MKVSELIALLSQWPADTTVLAHDERTGFPEPVAGATLEPADPAFGLEAVVILETQESAAPKA